LASIINKHQNGLTLPYSDKKIITSYFIAAGITITVFYIIAAILYQATIIGFFIVVSFANLLVLISLYLAYKSKKKKRVVNVLIGTIFYVLSILII
jgi:predicted ABC-type exoprotein transport system permease subunit